MIKIYQTMKFLLTMVLMVSMANCSDSSDPATPTNPTNPTNPSVNEVDFWLTKGNQSVKLQKQTTVLQFGTATNIYPTITVNQAEEFQTLE
jgi:glucosylceramidase